MKRLGLLEVLVLLFFTSGSFAQSSYTAAIDTLLAQSGRLPDSQADSALHLAFKAAELSQQNSDVLRETKSYREIADAYDHLNEIDLRITYAQKAVDASASITDEVLKTRLLFDLARSFYSKGYYDLAEALFRKVKAASDKLGDEEIRYLVCNAFGFSFLLNDGTAVDSAEYYFAITLKIAEKQKDSLKLARSYMNIAVVYSRKQKWDEQLVYMKKALEIYTKKRHMEGLTNANKSIGDMYYFKKENAKAIEYYLKEYAYSKEMKSNVNISYAACDLAYMYAMEKKIALLDKYAKEAKEAATQTNSFVYRKYVGGWISEAYEAVGNEKSALEFYKMYAEAKDSINDRARIAKSSRAEAQTDYENKVQQMKIEEAKHQAIEEEKAHNQKLVRNMLITGILIALLLLVVAYRSYVQKKRANVVISKQKEEVETQKLKIEEKNKEITDSINYAKLIQRSILPDPKEITKSFPNSFGLYKPKDVVSGDFYWFARKNNIAMIAAVDCTGHGVPGALMSMIGVDKLNEAVGAGLTHPAEILSHLNKGVKTTLRQKASGSGSQDGMDIALISFNLEGKSQLDFAGAQRPLWLIRNNEITEYKPSKVSIGGNTPDNQEFISHSIELQKGDCIYIFSDGFADQFGGSKGKKIMTKNFKETLLAIQNIPFAEQEKELDKKLTKWQGHYEQVDDILVIGIKI